MEERALLLALGILAAVVWPGRLAADQPRTKWDAWAVVGAGLAVLLVWYAWRFSAKFGLWIPNPFLFAPVDSLLIGYLVGHIIPGGRRPEATRADAAPTGHGQQFLPSDVASVDGRQHPAAAQPNNNEGAGRGVREATDRALGWAASLLATVRGTVTGVAVVALLVLGVVPPQTWGHFVHRLEGLKAAGVEFTLGTVVGDKAAQDISVAALPPGNLDGKSEEDRHGFVPPRLDRMKNLTFPVSLPEEQGPETVLERNPTYFLFAKHVEARRRTSGPSERQPHVRGVQRDRAMLLHLHRAGAAVDTRRPGRGTSVSDERHGASRDEGNIIQGLLDLCAQQEVVLARLADHVACVSEVIKETNDRRLTEYRTARVVEELYMFARIWSSLERSHVMYRFGLGHSVGDAARAAAFRELLLRTHLLTLRIKEFTWWADKTIQALRAGRAEATTAGTGGASQGRVLPSNRDQEAPIPPSPALVLAAASTALVPSAEGSSGSSASRFAMPPNRGPGVEKRVPVSSRCDFGQEAVAAIEEAINPAQSDGTRRRSVPDDEALRRSDEMFARQGFTPYLVTLVAQALSAMGDHNAALRLLVGWQQDLVWLAHLAGSGDGLLDRTGAQPTPRMRPALKGTSKNPFLGSARIGFTGLAGERGI